MEHGKHELTCIGQFFEQGHDLFAIAARQSTCWLIQEQTGGPAEKLQTDVDSFSLTA